MLSKIARFFAISLCAFLLFPTGVAANWYAGSQEGDANGVRAYISTPMIINIISGGEANWVSSFFHDGNGDDWIQTGWRYYQGYYGNPRQYVEWCIDCTEFGGTYRIEDSFATQNWGTTIHYRVSDFGNGRWCAYTEGYLRFCVDNIHTTPVAIMAMSEIHISSQNQLNTDFNVVQYYDSTEGSWKDFGPNLLWVMDFPYSVEIFTDSHFRTYRSNTHDLFLPNILK